MPVPLPDLTKPAAIRLNEELITETTKAIQALFPVQEGGAELRASNVQVDASSFDASALTEHQEARQTGKTRAASVYADMELWRGGQRVQSRKRLKIGELPLASQIGSFMVGGNDWFVPFGQQRLKPGVYARETSSGAFEAFIPTKGAAMTVWMERAKGRFNLGVGTTNVPLIPLLIALGLSEQDVIRAWGNDDRAKQLLAINRGKGLQTRDVDKIYEAMYRLKQDRDLVKAHLATARPETQLSTADKVFAIRQWLASKEIDPYVTRHTLRQEFDRAGPDLLLAASRRVLDIERGEAASDDRDAPEYKYVIGLPQMMAERIARAGRMLQAKLKRDLTDTKASIGDLVGPSWLNPITVGYFGGSLKLPGGLAHTAEAANPLAIQGEQSVLTLTGDGGIQSSHAITNEARLFRASSAGFVDPVRTPEGSSVGITTHATIGAYRHGRHLASMFAPVKNGIADFKTPVGLTIEEARDLVISYPDEWDRVTGKAKHPLVRANVDGKVTEVEPTKVDYVIPAGAALLDSTSNSALFFSNTHPNRGMMAGKHLSQALPLAHRELPLVSWTAPTGEPLLKEIAAPFTVRAKVAGKVTSVSPTAIVVNGVKHELFDKYPMQAKVALHHIPVVKVGDVVEKDQLLADTNYTKNGELALGVNLRSAYLPWKNASNYEDAIIISESAAKKLSSLHNHKLHLDLDNVIIDPKLYVSQFPTKLTSANLKELDATGVIKEGSAVTTGTVLITAVRKREADAQDRSGKALSQIHKMLLRPYADVAVTWNETTPGRVVRVVRTRDGITVHVETTEPTEIGDKLSMSSAAKGTISTILPDHRMPRTKDGKHIEVLFNPHGVAGRINPSQTLEQAAGKLVRDGGGEHTASVFDGRDHAREIAQKLSDKGLSHAEILHDPTTGRDIENPVATGYNYVFKLDHPVRKKFSARGNEGYTMDETPTKGRGKGGQSIDGLTSFALLGHNAHAILGESYGVRGTKNDDFWRAYQAGETPPPPKVPFVFEKFQAMLNAAGVNTERRGHTMLFMPMTEKSVLARSAGEIQQARTLRSKDLAEEKGGLFDLETTGGIYGDQWSHIALGRHLPHPLYEKVIRDLTGITGADFYGLIAHTRFYNTRTGRFQDEPSDATQTGDAAFRTLLSFDVDTKIRELKDKLRTAVGSDRNRYHRAVRYLLGLKSSGMTAADAYLTSAVPVVPPRFRPIVEMANGGLRVADSNLLYRDIIMTRKVLDQAEKDGTLPPPELAKARAGLYDAFSALVGVGKPLTQRRDNEELAGFVDVIRGKTNKEGLFQRQLARRRNDYTGRSTVEPDSTLGPDEIGLPEEMAWKIYKPTVVRRLSMLGMNPADAMKAVEDRLPIARAALDQELKERPVLYNRAPSLHRWSIAAGMPVIHTGKDVKISPLVVGPYGADFDGDTFAIHTPILDSARDEAFKLLPSRNLFYDKDRTLAYTVDKDVITGLFAITKLGKPVGKSYASDKDALEAYFANKDGLRSDSIVTVDGKPRQIGVILFEQAVPSQFRQGITYPIDGKKLETILTSMARQAPGRYNDLSRALAQLGFNAAARVGGITGTVDELVIDRSKIKQALDRLEAAIKAAPVADRPEVARKVYLEQTQKELDTEVESHLKSVGLGGAVFLEAKPSSKLGFDSYRQMMASPTLVTNTRGEVEPYVIKSSYGSGMSSSDYVLTTPGARAGIVARSLATALPGYFAKEIAGVTSPVRISEADCGTQRGIAMPVLAPSNVKNYDADLLDRHLAVGVLGYRRNDLVTPQMLASLRDHNIQSITVRSPMTCEASSPPCQMCAGRDPTGTLHPIGANIGYNYGQAVAERSTQAILRAFHSGGTVGANEGLSRGFARLSELLHAPSTVKDQGTVALISGTVTEVRQAPQGGYFVVITPSSGPVHEHYIEAGRTRKVSAGDTVHAGDPLSDGAFLPQDIAATKGLLAAQQYVVDEARKAYQAAGAVVRRPVLEVVVAAAMRFMEVTDDGGEPDLAVGDVLPETVFQARQRRNSKIKGVPHVPGISRAPIVRSNDLMERLNFQRLEDALRQVPATGGKSDLRGEASPLAGMAYGAMFRPTPLQPHIDQGDSAFNAGFHR